MTKVTWALEARARLEDIESFIAQENATAAKETVVAILARARHTKPRHSVVAKSRTTAKTTCANSWNVPTVSFIA